LFGSKSLVGWWKFDEGDGEKAIDSSGNANTGRLHHMDENSRVEGKFGKALSFNGKKQHISVKDRANLSFGTESFSISLWVKTKADTVGMMVINGSSGPPGSGKRYSLRYHGNGRVTFVTDDNVVKSLVDSGNVRINDEKWHHIAAVRDRNTNMLKLYIDGKRRAENNDDTVNIDSPGEPLYIGRDSDEVPISGYVDGLLDDVRIFSYALSEDEAAALYAGENVGGKRSNVLPVLVIIAVVAVIAACSCRKKKRQINL